MNPGAKVTIHELITEQTIKDHFLKFGQMAEMLGVPKQFIFTEDSLSNDQGRM